MNNYKIKFKNGRTTTICCSSNEELKSDLIECTKRFNSEIDTINDMPTEKLSVGGFLVGTFLGGILGNAVAKSGVKKTAKTISKRTKSTISKTRKGVSEFRSASSKSKKMSAGGLGKPTYIPNEDIENIKTNYGQTISGRKLLDGAYATGKVKKPTMSRTQFEDESYEYAKGGNVPSITRKVNEVNRLIALGNENDISVIDSSSTWESPMKYKPIRYSNGTLYIEYEELDLYKNNRTGVKQWITKKDKVLKRNMEYDSPLNNIAKWYRKALKNYDVEFEDGGNIGSMALAGAMPELAIANEVSNKLPATTSAVDKRIAERIYSDKPSFWEDRGLKHYAQGGSTPDKEDNETDDMSLWSNDELALYLGVSTKSVKENREDAIEQAEGLRQMSNEGYYAGGGGVKKRNLMSMANLVDWKGEGIKKWYIRSYPTDDLGEELNDTNTFADLWNGIHKRENVYNIMGVGDSVIRERLFEYLSLIYDVDYSYVYDKWLDSADEYAKGGNVLATSPTLDGINKLISEYLYGSTITLVPVDSDKKSFEVHNKKGKTQFLVVLNKNKYQFIPNQQYAKGGSVGQQITFKHWSGDTKNGTITEDLGDGNFQVSSGFGNVLVNQEDIISSNTKTPERKKMFGLFEDGGEVWQKPYYYDFWTNEMLPFFVKGLKNILSKTKDEYLKGIYLNDIGFTIGHSGNFIFDFKSEYNYDLTMSVIIDVYLKVKASYVMHEIKEWEYTFDEIEQVGGFEGDKPVFKAIEKLCLETSIKYAPQIYALKSKKFSGGGSTSGQKVTLQEQMCLNGHTITGEYYIQSERKDNNGKKIYVVLDKEDGKTYECEIPSRIIWEAKSKFSGGGSTNSRMDLFEDYENIPPVVQNIIDKYTEKFGDDLGDMSYEDMADMHNEIYAVGYTFESYLDNVPYGLRPIGVNLNELQGFEEEPDDDKE